MESIIVSFKVFEKGIELDLEVPHKISAGELIDRVLPKLDLNQGKKEQYLAYKLVEELNWVVLGREDILASLEIADGDTLTLVEESKVDELLNTLAENQNNKSVRKETLIRGFEPFDQQ